MISRFFIDRPIFASVISIFITLMGLAAMFNLPIEQYPSISPPQVYVSASYPGASAETISETVAAPLEQQINGVENMIYMESQSSSSGFMEMIIYFDIGSDVDRAQIDVQNKINQIMSQLPLDVQRQGITVQKQSPSFLMIIAIQAEGQQFDEIYTSNYASINIVDELKRIKGVSQAEVIGAREYSMRLWLKPDRMAQLQISTSDIIKAIEEQNAQYAVGQIGQEPTSGPVELTLPVTAQGRLVNPEDFENIIIRANTDGSMVQLKDIGRAELGAQSYNIIGELNGKPTTLIAVYQQYGANALEVAQNVYAAMDKLSKNFPSGIAYSIPYDITKFVKVSIREVTTTIFEAGLLVTLVVFIFLQSLRTTIIPVQALVVSIIGTFAGMYFLGLSINTLTLFGLVLAVGIVVDDAIVVIENVESNINACNLSPLEAAKKAMEEVTGPIIAIVFVLCAVFLPVAFLGGIAGQLYKQFAITIVISVVISGIVALTSSPALAALLIRPCTEKSSWASRFDKVFEKFKSIYIQGVGWLIGHSKTALSLFAILLLLIALLFKTVPTAFVPAEDQGYVMAFAILPDGSSLQKTEKVTKQVEQIALNTPGVDSLISLTGYSLLEDISRPFTASYFVILKDWKERGSQWSANHILKQLNKSFSEIPEALILPFNPPSIQGLGVVGGFEFWIQNRGGENLGELQNIADQFIEKAAQRPELKNITSNINVNEKQLFIDLDRAKALALNVPVSEVYQSLQVLLGSVYVNDFNKFGKVYKVMLQADPSYRNTVEDVDDIYVRSSSGEMVPIKALIDIRNIRGPTLISRFNGFEGAKLNGNAAPGYSSGEAMRALEETAKEALPETMSFSWSGESFQEQKTGGVSVHVLLAALVIVFLILAALYEKWALPFSVLLAVPFGIFGAFLAIWVMEMNNDIYFQIGLVALIALSAKNAILIAGFANAKHQQGMSYIEAAVEAAKLRFRAILMTSLTFIFGVIPLVWSSGAGAASRQAVGTGVLGGMISATFLAIFFVPLFYIFLEKWTNKKKDKHE